LLCHVLAGIRRWHTSSISCRTSASTPLTLLLTVDREPNLDDPGPRPPLSPGAGPAAPLDALLCMDSDRRSMGRGGRRAMRGRESALDGGRVSRITCRQNVFFCIRDIKTWTNSSAVADKPSDAYACCQELASRERLRSVGRIFRLLPTHLPFDMLSERDLLELSGSYFIWEN